MVVVLLILTTPIIGPWPEFRIGPVEATGCANGCGLGLVPGAFDGAWSPAPLTFVESSDCGVGRSEFSLAKVTTVSGLPPLTARETPSCCAAELLTMLTGGEDLKLGKSLR